MFSAHALVPSYRRAATLVGGVNHTGLTSASDLSQLDSQVDSAFNAFANAVTGTANCALSASDQTSWQGDLASWQAQHANNLAAIAQAGEWYVEYNPFAESGTVAALGDLYASTQGYQTKIANWQARFASLCTAYTPPPTQPGTPPPPPSGSPTSPWYCTYLGVGCPANTPSASDWSGAIKYAAVAAIVIVLAIYLGPLMGTMWMAHHAGASAAGRK